MTAGSQTVVNSVRPLKIGEKIKEKIGENHANFLFNFGSQKWQKSSKLPYSCTPNEIKKIILKILFFHLFYNSAKFLEQLLFLVKMHIFTPKGNFPKNHGFL